MKKMASSLKYIVVSFGTFFCNFVSLFSIKREEPDTPPVGGENKAARNHFFSLSFLLSDSHSMRSMGCSHCTLITFFRYGLQPLYVNHLH